MSDYIHLSDTFKMNSNKDNFALEYFITKVQENKEGMRLKRTLQLLVNTATVHLWGKTYFLHQKKNSKGEVMLLRYFNWKTSHPVSHTEQLASDGNMKCTVHISATL
jgi:hypothetical protein